MTRPKATKSPRKSTSKRARKKRAVPHPIADIVAGLLPSQQQVLMAWYETLFIPNLMAKHKGKGNIGLAARAVSINRCNHYDWMKTDAAYRAAHEAIWEHARHESLRQFIRSTSEGVRKEIFEKGKLTRVQVEQSPQLIAMRTKAMWPELFSDKVEVTGKDGGPLAVSVTYEIVDPSAR